MKGVEPPRRRRQILSLVRLPIPPHPHFTLYIVGGGWWIRTTESNANRFTVCPLWPLGNPPMVMESFFDYELPSHDALGIVQGSE